MMTRLPAFVQAARPRFLGVALFALALMAFGFNRLVPTIGFPQNADLGFSRRASCR